MVNGSECNKTFKTIGNLSSHRQTHRPRTHICENCGDAFSTSTKLTTHRQAIGHMQRYGNKT